MYFGDVVIRIDDDLDDVHIRELELDLRRQDGIYEANIHENWRHLLVVDFDPDRLQIGHIIQTVRDQGFSAETLID